MEFLIGNSSRSMETKRICILLMNDDFTCKNIVAEMLQHCNNELLQIGDLSQVLNAIRNTKERLQLILTNVYKSESNGKAIIQYIQRKFNLPILLMCPDKTEMVMKGKPCSFAAYVITCLNEEEVTSLWGRSVDKEKERERIMGTSLQDDILEEAAMATDEATCSKKRAQKNESGEDDSVIEKKGRVQWSHAMHKKFLEAIEIIGEDRAVPKKIVEVMNIEGLTRENVASHLQKHRELLKRERAHSSSSNSRSEYKASTFLPEHSRTRLNSSPSSYLMQERYNMTSSDRDRNRYDSHPRLMPSKLNQHYLNTRNEFSSTTAVERNKYANLGNSQFGQSVVPRFHSSRKFRIYSDRTKNMLVSTSTANFCGFKLTNDGNSIQFGENGAFFGHKTGNISYTQQNPISDQNPLISTDFTSQEPFHFEENPAQSAIIPDRYTVDEIFSSIHLNDSSPQQSLGNYWNDQENTEHVPNQFQNEFQNISREYEDVLGEPLRTFEHERVDSPSIFVPDQDCLLPWLDIPGNDISTFIESIQNINSSPVQTDFNGCPVQEEIDQVVVDGTGSASSLLDWDWDWDWDWEELDVLLYNNDCS